MCPPGRWGGYDTLCPRSPHALLSRQPTAAPHSISPKVRNLPEAVVLSAGVVGRVPGASHSCTADELLLRVRGYVKMCNTRLRGEHSEHAAVHDAGCTVLNYR